MIERALVATFSLRFAQACVLAGLALLAACASSSPIAEPTEAEPDEQVAAASSTTSVGTTSSSISGTTTTTKPSTSEPSVSTDAAVTTTATIAPTTSLSSTTSIAADIQSACAGLDYNQRQVNRRSVCVANELEQDHQGLALQVMTQLRRDLTMLDAVLPPDAIAFSEGVTIWIEYDVADFPGGVYHPSPEWLTDNGYPPNWAGGIQFGNARNYLSWIEQQPAMLLHEMAHAWHHQFLGYDYAEINSAYAAALDGGQYDSVEYIDGGFFEAYAATNPQEYFAELTEAIFWINDYYPFNAEQLSFHDPAGAQTVREAWGLTN